MGHGGRAWTLILGTGEILGEWRIDQVQETRSEFYADATARKIEFSLALTRVDLPATGPDLHAALGDLRLSAGGALA